MESMMKELNLDEMTLVYGAGAYEIAEELARYTDSLLAKYQCGDLGFDYLMTVCTPEEKAHMRELRNAMFAEYELERKARKTRKGI